MVSLAPSELWFESDIMSSKMSPWLKHDTIGTDFFFSTYHFKVGRNQLLLERISLLRQSVWRQFHGKYFLLVVAQSEAQSSGVWLPAQSSNNQTVIIRDVETGLFAAGLWMKEEASLSDQKPTVKNVSHTAGQVKTPLFLLINPHTWWSILPGETFPLWGASVNRCTTVPHICGNNITNYSELLDIFRCGTVGKKRNSKHPWQHDWDDCVKFQSPGESPVLFSHAVASSRVSICVTRWHWVTVGQIHTVLDGCELHRTTCNSCKWCIFNHNMSRFSILLSYFAFFLIIKMLSTNSDTRLLLHWKRNIPCFLSLCLSLFWFGVSVTLIRLTWARTCWEHLNQLQPLSSHLAVKGWPGFLPLLDHSVWYSLCQNLP